MVQEVWEAALQLVTLTDRREILITQLRTFTLVCKILFKA